MAKADPMLMVRGLCGGYAGKRVLEAVDFTASAGQISCIMGRNGAGKSTFVQALMGLIQICGGEVLLDGASLSSLPAHKIPAAGLAWVPQGRRLFGGLTVSENLAVGGLVRGTRADLDRVLTLFPRLQERLDQPAATLSGGEQQMLAIARALRLRPRVLLLDEPTEGLQPSVVSLIRSVIQALRDEGVAVVLVEQSVEAVLEMADSVSFMVQGRIAASFDITELRFDGGAGVFQQYLGV